MLLPLILGTLLGAIIGSFLAALILRWPKGQSVIHGRSRCDHCGTPIPATQLLPLLTFVWLRGRARCCDARIDPLHFWVELVATAIGLISFTLFGWQGWASALMGWLLLAIGVLDWRHYWLCAAIARSVPIWRVHTPRALESLREFAGSIVEGVERRPILSA